LTALHVAARARELATIAADPTLSVLRQDLAAYEVRDRLRRDNPDASPAVLDVEAAQLIGAARRTTTEGTHP
jgi:hypothetical protein